jgi:CDP-diacylglycerol pyrophosphatase
MTTRLSRVAIGLLARVTIGATVALAASCSFLAISYGGLDPSSLWAVEANCMAVKRSTGLAFPCVEVALPTSNDTGWVLLKSPKSATEFLLSPAEPVGGLEDVLAVQQRARALWQRAWEARRHVGVILRRQLNWDDVGLAVNSATTRTQDQFHIHIECVAAQTKAVLATLTWPESSAWRPGLHLGGADYWVRRLAPEVLGLANVVQLVREIPAAPKSLRRASVALIGVTKPNHEDGLLLLANFDDVPAEDLLDHRCGGEN